VISHTHTHINTHTQTHTQTHTHTRTHTQTHMGARTHTHTLPILNFLLVSSYTGVDNVIKGLEEGLIGERMTSVF